MDKLFKVENYISLTLKPACRMGRGNNFLDYGCI